MRTEQAIRVLEVKRLTMMGIFIALAVVGSYLKIPSPAGTIAFDSAPAFLAALLIGPSAGAIVAFVGHLATSLIAGFPLTVLMHGIIGLIMAGIAILMGWCNTKWGIKPALLLTLLLNGIGSPALFIYVPGFGWPFFTAMVIPLLVGTALNLFVVGLLYAPLKRRG
ncbi:ECF transporter S component [Ammoniphilus sp. YIM 78166]|uniref:ECF transporter S component n=1 Tax=Ammoniphilus sp. YIM 78166 TaxID=1644106 RepID=UPI00106FC870|nr:ECF transporter S component [Ammoniphilus sp. YIM 78166]